MKAGDSRYFPMAIAAGYQASIRLLVAASVVYCEVHSSAGQRISDFASMVLAADLSALADGQHI